MIRFNLFFVFIFFNFYQTLSQVYIDWSPSRVADELIYVQHTNSKSISEVKIYSYSDSLHANVNGVKPLTMDCRFSSIDKKCNDQKIKFECDECMQNWINDILSIKKYKWKQLDKNRYISAPEFLIEFHFDTSKLSIQFLKSTLSREEYKKLYKH